jgi:hypothetical protein
MRVGKDFCMLAGAAGPAAHRPTHVFETACVPSRVAGSPR